MKHTFRGSLLFILAIMLVTSSCHKENTSFDYNQAVETVSDYVEAQQMTDLILSTYFKAITDSTLLTNGASEIDGAFVSCMDSSTKIVIEYPSWGKDDGYGHYRKGKYEASTESNLFDSLAVINFTFHNFYYDDDSISVEEFTLENLGATTNHNYLFNVSATDILRKFHDTTGHIKYQVEQNFIRVKDPSSPYYTNDDYFEVSGNMIGVARNGDTFNSSTSDISNLIDYLSCQWIKGGVTEVDLPEFIYSASVDFNNEGECKNQFLITINETLFIRVFD